MSAFFPQHIKDQISRRAFISFDLVEIDMPTPIYLCNAPFDITQITQTNPLSTIYRAQGSFLTFSSINTTDEIRVNNIALTFSGSSPFYLNLVLNDNYLHRGIRIYKQFIDQKPVLSSNRLQLPPPIMIYKGTMVGANVDESLSESTITINTSNQFYDFMRINGRRTNNASHTRLFPNDRGMEFSTSKVLDIQWGVFK
jgi:hypothetical protein